MTLSLLIRAQCLTLWSWKNAHCYWIMDNTLVDRTHASNSIDIPYGIYNTHVLIETNALIAPMPFPHRLKMVIVLFPHETRTTNVS